MVHNTHSDYPLAIRHITEYYDMKLAMFGWDSDGSMVVAFPVFVKGHASEPKTLYEIEMVKVPIPNKNKEADSYSEVKYSKLYLAINDDYYIQLRIQELWMCKQIRHTYYCEELFLIKHKAKHSCESAIFYNLTADVVYSVCQLDYLYNTTVTPSILDGGSNILLANMLSTKRLICMKIPPWPDLCPVTPMYYSTGQFYVIVIYRQASTTSWSHWVLVTQELLLPCTLLLIQPFNISCQNLACLTPIAMMADYSHKNIFLTYF